MLIVAVVIFSGCLGPSQIGKLFPPQKSQPPAPTKNADNQINSGIIDTSLKYLSFPDLKGRLAGTEEAEKAGSFISAQFTQIGFQPVEQKVQCYSVKHVQEDSRWVLKLTDEKKTSRNILAEKTGIDKKKIIVAAHYDHLGTNAGVIFPGANDNASGVSALLTTARQVKEQTEGKYSVVFAALTGEEQGFQGSEELLKSLSDQTLVMINLDCVGNSAGHYAVSGHPGRYLKALETAAAEAGVKLSYLNKDDEGYMYSDHEPFIQRGYSAFTIHSESWRQNNHTPSDSYENVSVASIEQAAQFAVKIIAQIQS